MPSTLTPSTPRAFRCRCGRPVFFDNHLCLGCGTQLGYVPERQNLASLQPGPVADTWQVDLAPPIYRRCANATTAAACNWMVAVQAHGHGQATQALCLSCRLNRVIPFQGSANTQLFWSRVEAAKRRLVSSLMALGLPLASRLHEDPLRGLAFDLLAPEPGQLVTTGHQNGIITLNIDEADDAKREQHRVDLHEPYRTVLGHLRHEVGHYYWSRLVDGTAWHAPFQLLFGDERTNYALALQNFYDHGPAADWSQHHVSAYASAHPWEDWAETWAHYLHMVDSVDTALSFGLYPPQLSLELEPFDAQSLWRHDCCASQGTTNGFFALLNAWILLNSVVNELCRSMGQADFYPFVLSKTTVTKLHFVHRLVRG